MRGNVYYVVGYEVSMPFKAEDCVRDDSAKRWESRTKACRFTSQVNTSFTSLRARLLVYVMTCDEVNLGYGRCG